MKFSSVFKYLSIMVLSTGLVAVSLNAYDNSDNLSESVIGRILGVEEKGPCSKDMVFVLNSNGGFCIDKYEVSAGDACQYLDPNSEEQTALNINNSNCQGVSLESANPWRYVSQIQAAEICAKAGKRLPSNAEWMRAALGTPDKNNTWTNEDCQLDSNWESQPGLTGSASLCVSSVGAYDMIGNVWEWVDESSYDGKIDDFSLPEEGYLWGVTLDGIPTNTDFDSSNSSYSNDYLWIKDKGHRGVSRGGYWKNKDMGGRYSMYIVLPPSSSGAGLGFRCVK